MLYHVACDAANWRGAPMRALDATLRAEGSCEVRLPWHKFALLGDGLHFTAAGQRAFQDALVERLVALGATSVPGRRWLLLSDSTVAHGDRRGRVASRRLERVLRRQGQCPRVDARCGSGYLSSLAPNDHVHPRLAPCDVLVLIIGWNDAGRRVEDICAAAARTARTIRRISALGRRRCPHVG